MAVRQLAAWVLISVAAGCAGARWPAPRELHDLDTASLTVAHEVRPGTELVRFRTRCEDRLGGRVDPCARWHFDAGLHFAASARPPVGLRLLLDGKLVGEAGKTTRCREDEVAPPRGAGCTILVARGWQDPARSPGPHLLDLVIDAGAALSAQLFATIQDPYE